MPQGRARLILSTAPRRPITPRRLLRITDQRAIIETPAERVLRIVRERCPDLDLSLVLKPAALPPPKPEAAGPRDPMCRVFANLASTLLLRPSRPLLPVRLSKGGDGP